MKTCLFCSGNTNRLTGYFLFLFFVLSCLHAEAPKASVEDAEFVEARRLFWSGQYNESEKRIKAYLLAHPNHEPSRNFLLMIGQSRIYDRAKIDQTGKRLEEIRVGKLELKNADWRSVSVYLQDLANPKTNGKDPDNYINFINLLPSGFSVKISLDLRNVSLMRAIEYSCQQAGLRYVVDTWAVIIDLPERRK